MPDETIVCPSCRRPLRVPETQFGQVVQCPLCRVIFVAPVRAGSASPAPAEPAPAAPSMPSAAPSLPVEPPAPTGTTPTTPAEAAEQQRLLEIHRLLLLPGTSLLICGVLASVFLFARLNTLLAGGPEGLRRELEETPFATLLQPSLTAEGLHMMYSMQIVIFIIFLLLNLGMVIGAVQMLRLRTYWLAITGSILALLNLAGCCCLVTAPLGIWSLRVLTLPEVRNVFE